MTNQRSHSYRHHHHRHHHHSSRWKRRLKAMAIVVSVLFFVFCSVVIFFPEQYRSFLSGLQTTAWQSGLLSHPRSKYHYDGIDVSHHQGPIDWPLVASDTCIQFVYIKATEGSTHVDTLYQYNIREAKRAGLLIGSYHFLTSSSSMRSQFINFITQVDSTSQHLLPMVDVEWSGVKGWNKRQIQDSLAVFVGLVKQHYGSYPLLYADSRFYNAHLSPRFDKLPLFIAHYSDEAPVVKGAHRHYIWQRDQHGWVSGINREVDLNAFASGTTITDILLPLKSNE